MVKSLSIIGAAAALAISTVSSFTPHSTPCTLPSQRTSTTSPLHATLTPLSTPSTTTTPQTHTTQSPNHHSILRIYNDNINTREYVAVCLVQVVGLCESRAYYTMQDAHDNGIAKVGEYLRDVAECYEEQLGERGILCDVVLSE